MTKRYKLKIKGWVSVVKVKGKTPMKKESEMTHAAHPSKPSVGRIVHFQSYAEGQHVPTHQAAIITSVEDADAGIVSLTVFKPSGFEFVTKCKLDEETPPASGTWCWPSRA